MLWRAAALSALVLVSAFAQSVPPGDKPVLPRNAPDMPVLLPQGGQLNLSQYRGKVVVMQILLTTCPHCQHASEMLTHLAGEYTPRGVQIIGCSFDPMPRLVVPDYVRDHKISFPVGYQTREAVYSFLGADPNQGIHVPQFIFIDRSGVIRNQSLFRGDGETAKEQNVRSWIEKLAAEKPRTAAAAHSSRKRK